MTHNDDSARRAAKHKRDMRGYSRTIADGIVIAESRHVELDDTATRDYARELASLESYLATRFYPPLDRNLGPPILTAIAALNRGELDAEVELPGHIATVPRAARAVGRDWRVSARELVRSARLEHMLDDDRLGDELAGEDFDNPGTADAFADGDHLALDTYNPDATYDDAAKYVASVTAPAPLAPSWAVQLHKGTDTDGASPQSIRAARSAAQSRGSGESLTGAILSLLDALDRGATVTIYAQEG